MPNKLREALVNKTLTVGAWIQIGHPGIAEIFARAGFDWICVDLEHGAIGIETMTDIFRTVDAFDCVPVARLPVNDPTWIHRSLDAGAGGLIIPMVNTAAQARTAVREAKYPPVGSRGFGYSRANMHGMDFDNYIAAANDEIALVMQIEHKDAIRELDDIAAINGVDGLFIGPLDLSGSMGLTGRMDHPEVVEALDKYRQTCKDRNLSCGMHIVRPTPQNIKQNIADGYNMLALGVDGVFLDESSKAVLQTVEELK